MKQLTTIAGFVFCVVLSVAALAAEKAALPPDEQGAKERLNSSPRHGEMVDIEMPGSGTKIKSWVVFPEVKEGAPVVIVIQEIFGLSDSFTLAGRYLNHCFESNCLALSGSYVADDRVSCVEDFDSRGASADVTYCPNSNFASHEAPHGQSGAGEEARIVWHSDCSS